MHWRNDDVNYSQYTNYFFMCLFNKTGEELNEYGRERTKKVETSTFPMRKIPSMCRRVLAIENKNAVRMNRVFHVSPIFGKRGIRIALFSLPHTQAPSPWIVQAPCVYLNLKKAFHAIFLSS